MLIVTAIIACEVGFWVVLVAGLGSRYLLKRRTLSSVLLALVPVLDVALLAFITWDLVINGTAADFTHGLGAVYLGFTVAFGRQIIHAADVWAAHRFADGPPPVTVEKHGPRRVSYEWKSWFRMLLCAVITTVVLGAIILLVADTARTSELVSWIMRIWLIAAVWLVGWPVWESVRYAVTGRVEPAAPRHRESL
ncbi:hypothetical protein [Microbacterium sp. YY-01]|uniref:hypothetical protein n=1 Tax=Microbacterium sp. YY-01 TaxID=3421634 RepID=UPI003D16ADC0